MRHVRRCAPTAKGPPVGGKANSAQGSPRLDKYFQTVTLPSCKVFNICMPATLGPLVQG